MKRCGLCLNEYPALWKARTKDNPAMCRNCALKNSTPIGNYKITSNKASVSNKKSKPIPNISQKQKDRLKEYRKVRDEYFKENPVCEFPNCSSRDITLHHSRGKTGALLSDKKWFKSLCMPHHRFVEENPLEARKLGLSFNRLDK